MADLFLFDILPRYLINLDNSDLAGIKNNEKSLETFKIIAPCYKSQNETEIHECLLNKIFTKMCNNEALSLVKCTSENKGMNTGLKCKKELNLFINCG